MKLDKAFLRRGLKRAAIRLLLRPYYALCCRRPVENSLVLLADGHQTSMPYSMQAIAAALGAEKDLRVVEYFQDYSFCGFFESLRIMLRFLPLYARARTVFICDYFVPTACGKRPETTLVQLWHSGGLMKKLGMDSPEDAKGFLPEMYRNVDVFTASSPLVSNVLSKAVGLPPERFSPAGVTRIDLLYDKTREEGIRRRFAEAHPELSGKRLVLWAPTFRGNVRGAYLIGSEEILRLQRELPEQYALVIKTHRFSNSAALNTLGDFSSEELLALADLLITDYSSIYFDYLYYRRPIVLFAPDLAQYEAERGLYPDYRSLPGRFAADYDALRDAVLTADRWADSAYFAALDRLWESDMAYCDGHSCEKLLAQLGISENAEGKNTERRSKRSM